MKGPVTQMSEFIRVMDRAFAEGKRWMACAMESPVGNEVYFSSSKGEAIHFAIENSTAARQYRVIHCTSVEAAIKNITAKNKYTMNEKNTEALKGNLKYLGFGEGLNEQLEKNISAEKPEFTLQHGAVFNKQEMEATLHFKRGEQNEMYFFNRYEAKLKDAGDPAGDKQQTFYLDRGNGVTMKEAFNLLNGRAVNKDLVNKEGEKYNAWVQLDFEQKEQNGNYRMNRYHENYGYNLEEVLGRYPVKEISDPATKQDLIRSLEKGNLQAVKIEVGGKDQLHYIQADPKYKDITVMDTGGRPLSREQTEGLKISGRRELNGQEIKQEQPAAKKEQKQQPSGGGDDEDGPELKKKRTRKQGKGMSV